MRCSSARACRERWPPAGRSSVTREESRSAGMESQHQGYGPDQMFCLRWSNHQTNMLNVFNQLRYNESFVDVTLAVDGRVLKAHKMVLSACSPYFQKMFEMTPDKHPVVFIDRVHYQDMKRLLEFMYRGEVSIDQETLNRFLKVARSLRIRGLTEIEEPGGFSGGFSPSLGPMDEATRQRLAEQMAAAALAEFRPPHRTSVEVAPPSGAARRPASCPAEEETPRKAGRMEREPGRDQERPRDRQNSREPGREPGREPESKREPVQVNGTSSKEAAARVDTNSTSNPTHPATGLLMAKTEPEAAEPAGVGAPPPSPTGLKHERADVFCQPDIWISEGIYVAGHQQAAPAAAGHAAAREPPPSPPPGLEDTPLSPEDPASLLDYVTHEDGSVTCKLCGEQVPSRNHWYRHKYRTHAWHTYKCEDCGITYKSKRGFEAHLEAKHDRRADRSDREPARRRDWEGVARALEDTRKQKEEELVSDIINRVKRECAMEGEDYTRRGYVKHF